MAEITVTKDNYEQEVLKSDIPVLLDFWADWCGPCKMLSPIVSEIAEEYEGKIKVGKVNVDEERDLAFSFKVFSIPQLVVMKDGQTVKKSVGYMPKDDVEDMLKDI